MAMGSEVRELNNNTVKLESFNKMSSFIPLYLEDVDTLIFQPKVPIPAISVDCEGDLLLRVDPHTKEIVGVEIEDFENYFIVKYPALAPLWKGMKGSIKRNKCQNEELTTFLTIIQDMLNELVKTKDCILLAPTSALSQSPLAI